jgi:hypothetical protein
MAPSNRGKVNEWRWPNSSQRVAVVGRTGSGKTQFGSWLLSEAPFDQQPYVILDYKGDELLNSIDRIREIGLNEAVPKKPGLFILRPLPGQEEDVTAWLWKVWAREHVGLYFDEGYMLPRSNALRAIYTQGRSKRIPAITLSQRPVGVQREVFSEADFFAVFHLHHPKDKETVAGFVPGAVFKGEMKEYHSRWYDVAKNKLFDMAPVPDADTILDRFDERLAPVRRKL